MQGDADGAHGHQEFKDFPELCKRRNPDRPQPLPECGNDFASEQFETVRPTVAIVPIVSCQHQRAKRADLFAELEQSVRDMLRIAGDDHIVHEVIERAFRVGLIFVTLPHGNARWRRGPGQVEDVLDALAERIASSETPGSFGRVRNKHVPRHSPV